MTGSGKTGLAVIALEEAARSGIPTLVIDPKGDMGNLLLRFPNLEGSEFERWVDPAKARERGISVPELAAEEASNWLEGLSGWGLGSEDIRQLNAKSRPVIYTPGSSAGTPLNIVGNLTGDPEADEETARAETATLVSGLLALMDIDSDPLSSREHILLSNLIEKSRMDGRPVDLGSLIQQVMKPPIRKLGVFDVDTFYPESERTKLAMRLNALVASPTFGAWMEGEPLDVGPLLYGPDGQARCSVIYLAHLTEAERQFVVSLLLARVVTWMRAQPGTSDLRALLYMDEVFGFAPPSAEPPSKKAMLTILKQARAYGVGFLLSTQNPMDLDYKVMSNAGTWMVGRLQTERDKARILEGMQSAGGGDVSELDRRISNLGKREFVLHNTHDRGGPKTFGTRWAMSYLRGPLTKDEVSRLAGDQPAAPSAPPPATPSATSPSSPTPAAAQPGQVEVGRGRVARRADAAAWRRKLLSRPCGPLGFGARRRSWRQPVRTGSRRPGHDEVRRHEVAHRPFRRMGGRVLPALGHCPAGGGPRRRLRPAGFGARAASRQPGLRHGWVHPWTTPVTSAMSSETSGNGSIANGSSMSFATRS